MRRTSLPEMEGLYGSGEGEGKLGKASGHGAVAGEGDHGRNGSELGVGGLEEKRDGCRKRG